MRIVHYSHQLGLGGTEKAMQYLLEHLHARGHECYCVHHADRTAAAGGWRQPLLERLLGADRVLAYRSEAEFFEILECARPEVFHVHRSGRPDEFPVVPRLKRYVARCVETNVFGGHDPSDVLDLTLYPSDYLARHARAPRRPTAILYNPLKEPDASGDLREALGISPSTFVVGRLGRPDDHIFDAIALRAFAQLDADAGLDVLFLVQSPPPLMVAAARELGVRRIRFLTTPIVADADVTRFFNTIDVFAHSGRIGETFGLAIAEAMIHGKPVVSHRSRSANGHVPLVKAGGLLARVDDHHRYARYLRLLHDDEKRRKALGEAGRRYAAERFSLTRIGAQLEAHYARLLGRP